MNEYELKKKLASIDAKFSENELQHIAFTQSIEAQAVELEKLRGLIQVLETANAKMLKQLNRLFVLLSTIEDDDDDEIEEEKEEIIEEKVEEAIEEKIEESTEEPPIAE